MAISVKDIQEKVFPTQPTGGYNIEQVDDFLDEISEQLGALVRENIALNSELSKLSDALEEKERALAEAQSKPPDYNEAGYFKNLESAMRESLIGAQRLADETSAAAKAEADRMVKEAEAHEAEDKKRKEDAETRNQAEAFAYSTEKLVNDNKDKLSDDIVKEVTDKVNALKEALKGDDTEKVKTAQTELMTAAQKIGQVLYAQQGAEGAAAGADGAGASAGSASGSDDDTVEAEVVDDDDDKDNK